VEVRRVNDGFVLFVGRSSVLLERGDAESVIVSLLDALAQSSTVQAEPDDPVRPN
jgi:hypothetical protein